MKTLDAGKRVSRNTSSWAYQQDRLKGTQTPQKCGLRGSVRTVPMPRTLKLPCQNEVLFVLCSGYSWAHVVLEGASKVTTCVWQGVAQSDTNPPDSVAGLTGKKMTPQEKWGSDREVHLRDWREREERLREREGTEGKDI